MVLLLWLRVGLPGHSFLAPGCGGCALNFAGINLLVDLDFPSLICLNGYEVNIKESSGLLTIRSKEPR